MIPIIPLASMFSAPRTARGVRKGPVPLGATRGEERESKEIARG